eukprot:TRINITY_DN2335_c0_g1_i2.p2 TRINITY_DN2335_c0_g1~~TRINITY_DN2335_c0_g1_i2.p2  ORF type:complete len:394 (-),score=58.95 TRINITY_DN2335_c0_g1_i2:505-1662(-)
MQSMIINTVNIQLGFACSYAKKTWKGSSIIRSYKQNKLSTLQQQNKNRCSLGVFATTPTEVIQDSSATKQVEAKRVKEKFVPSSEFVSHTWIWKDKYKIRYASAGCGKPVLLVHGFDASIGHYRKIFNELAKDHKVYAVDLLGFGGSDKPALDYCIDLWRDQILDFIDEFIESPVVLVGNSIGSTICLMTNGHAKEGQIRGTVFLNIAGGMNNKQQLNDWRVWLALPIFYLVDFLLKNKSIGPNLFEKFRSKENIENVLKQVYANQEAVDDALISLIYEPSTDKGAFETFVSIITGPAGPLPMQMMQYAKGPFLLLWGDKDPFTPLDGPVGKYFTQLSETREDVELFVLNDTGHCPQDDRPELVLEKLQPWLKQIELQTNGGQSA